MYVLCGECIIKWRCSLCQRLRSILYLIFLFIYVQSCLVNIFRWKIWLWSGDRGESLLLALWLNQSRLKVEITMPLRTSSEAFAILHARYKYQEAAFLKLINNWKTWFVWTNFWHKSWKKMSLQAVVQWWYQQDFNPCSVNDQCQEDLITKPPITL